MQRNKRAFTLIELLVVVLIIGILAAVAMPQYQKAVWKSRFATIKNIAKTIAAAEEVYYLANGSYTDRIQNLDIEIPTPERTLEVESYGTYYYKWGACGLEVFKDVVASVSCHLNNADDRVLLGYMIYLNHSNRTPGKTVCFAYGSNKMGIPYQICKNETNHSEADVSWSSSNIYGWNY